MSDLSLRCATWNVHRARGTDGRVDPDRVMNAIEESLVPLGLDVLALQEADEECVPHAGIFDAHHIAECTGLRYTQANLRLRWGPQSDGFLGTVLFLSPTLKHSHADIIDLPGHCHRGAIAIETKNGDKSVRIISTHLSLSQPLRVLQMRILGQYLRRRPKMQTVLLGDLNEWRPWGGLMMHPRCVGTALKGPAHCTFPSTRPFLPLDRILTDAPGEVRDVAVVGATTIAQASDHLPLTAVVTVP